ncbi:alpha/beta hydrolase [Butyrivibrio sp. CB08]|uniref:alpha/beta hydrolase n=1 Tax=Butyrivibrio sp. CB08 TaxID=2364879 RepID=UPI001313DF92|nr:alpha/beta hydrolase [Butyrivibrio sp. CB08]
MDKKKKIKRIILILALLLVVSLVAAFVGFKIYTSNYYAADEKEIEEVRDLVGDKAISFTDETGTVFIPSGQDTRAVIIFYPGGKVEFSAYSSLMYELAAKGYVCVIPKMPDNLAFLGVDVIDDIRRKYAEEMTIVGDVDWYLAGHSLGGVAAGRYLAENAGNANGGFKGLILCASYPADDLSGTNLRMLSIRGSNDGVLKADKYEESRGFWPSNSTEKVIDGGIHSYFGSYGIQAGDGTPTISNQEQIEITASLIDEWISGN